MLEFFFRHYEPWVDRFVFFDDGSTDGTLELLRSKQNVEVRAFHRIRPDSFSLSAQAVRNNCWKESRGRADWVIVTDVDEHLYHPRLKSYLRDCKRRGITCIPALGFDMVTDSLPSPHEHLARTRTLGAPSHGYSKLRVFDPNAIEKTNFGIGGHVAFPSGQCVLPERDELLLLHYKQLGADYVVPRNAALGKRLGKRDIRNHWGIQFFYDLPKYQRHVDELKRKLVNVTDSNYCPWRDHREPRWWRQSRFTAFLNRIRMSLASWLWWLPRGIFR